MAHFVLDDAKIFSGGLDASGDTNQVTLELAAQMVNDTHFGDAWEKALPGLKKVSMSASGSRTLGADASDEVLFGAVGVGSRILSLSPDGGEAGEIVYFFKSVQGTYEQADAVGAIAPFSISAQGQTLGVRGQILHAKTARTATGSTTGIEVGDASATESVYGALHVFSASPSDTLDVIVESDVDADFASPTTRLTFSQMAAIGADWQSLAGPVTDTFWRITYTIAGTAPAFTFAVSLGVQ